MSGHEVVKKPCVTYIRVSTKQQGMSGLGLDAQREAIRRFTSNGEWEVLGSYEEIESGKSHKNRPELLAAMEHCKMTNSTLIVAKLDRLARDACFILGLRDSGIEFKICDYPSADRMTIGVMATLAEYERELISTRTKAALARSKKPKGIKAKENLIKNPEAAQQGRIAGAAANAKKANEFAMRFGKVASKWDAGGKSKREIAELFNDKKFMSPRGKTGTWTERSVANLITRYYNLTN